MNERDMNEYDSESRRGTHARHPPGRGARSRARFRSAGLRARAEQAWPGGGPG